ncbi:DUF4124 domain-containing protein [Enterovibrio nigricans]|uniref:DUF4124 domain-containing protein n=1 Tax=Enterovibrio nigricans DSM 22720 TaxID=1121868 RepID=A0A1T4UA08_9GAMM|nr:DUF4124 domain-containing protein [Enterovibrio nigricans]PKF51387.1 DUF4124 domain-containing protein [Enterovibrio nigricans]SKA49497.1 protein of unknown function [Enterovibrio nigricans DSM 22720]
MRIVGALLLISAVSFPVLADSYYRWVDEHGVVHFSDSPPEASIELNIELKAIPLNTHPDIAAPMTPEAPPVPPQPPAPLASDILLLSPLNEDTIRNSEGNITLSLSTDLPLGEQQSVRAVVDGKPLKSQKDLSIQLNNVDRGEHSIKVQLLQGGKVIASSDSATVFVHRTIHRKAPPKATPKPL